MKLIFVTATGLALTLAAQPGIASPSNDPPVMETIRFADLDLTLKSDQARLERRVRNVAARLCAGDDRASPAPPLPNPKCFGETMKNTRIQVLRAIARANGSEMLASAPPSDSHR